MPTWVLTTQRAGSGPAGPGVAGCLFGGLVALVGVAFAGALLCVLATVAAVGRVTRAFQNLFSPGRVQEWPASPHGEGAGKVEAIEAEFEVVERRPGPPHDPGDVGHETDP